MSCVTERRLHLLFGGDLWYSGIALAARSGRGDYARAKSGGFLNTSLVEKAGNFLPCRQSTKRENLDHAANLSDDFQNENLKNEGFLIMPPI